MALSQSTLTCEWSQNQTKAQIWEKMNKGITFYEHDESLPTANLF